MEHQPITVSIERRVNPERIAEATAWVQSGIRMAATSPGFLGSGWVRAGATSEIWHMLYRFSDEFTLDAWESSPQRVTWLEEGGNFMEESRVEKRTGIEGWFDAPSDTSPTTAAAPVTPPRWKQATSIWLGFFPVNLVFTILMSFVPGWDALGIFLHVLVSTLILAPIMTFWVLPFVTRMIKGWLYSTPRPLNTAELSLP